MHSPISSKLGLPDYIIRAAKEQISQENETFEDLIADLEQSKITMERERLEAASHKEEIKRLKEQLQSKQDKIDENKGTHPAGS